ncbi:MAG: 3-deoxy-8-phosphooctulonate synthase [Bdellovibrionales bacterium RIFOXYD12_FULL_39_22]|nr:MAG: 3-deoxy-8-phosphooctulonate synthase [Bdellovibrionales bacterium RIFOXYB1_FULL_39_21]OFZ43186.1 MAG: 3-deoxy-8-phosphooctulonate synthase [Bdellovibrionales bacterium RIFOXYC12_FULL_39_17]OFZ47924.1 MAG: 3-deoxy-8-phosphooctulonate synthase [Bdellovibrionales bacterium RIFOXYC1_FULL_39_130]OFZ75704.1 MAG: 3-deoxy-8-phosphooctulonate synthase [Bdellovibrionales bacterium RIFOXYD1_FULL_39_84]OFZ94194.1 MAG: 3-deoxy-8-phosphooctulonate synthase [Bdellovibrionales bacterium RIFOXYD12_FULL_
MKRKLDFYIGPCVLESEQLALLIANRIKKELAHLEKKITITFKGSFDKANRTSINSKRGPGIDEGLKILERVKNDFSLPVVTDFHHPEQAMAVASVVDVLQIPAFLSRQTDMIVAGGAAAAKYGRELKIKKGQFLAPHDAKNIVEKAQSFLPLSKIILTERGVSFGYNNLIVDMSSFQIMKSFGVRAVYDATHSIQMPGGNGCYTGGKRDQLQVLAQAAVAAGADGVFIETHPDPANAFSDSATCLHLDSVRPLVEKLLSIYEVL